MSLTVERHICYCNNIDIQNKHSPFQSARRRSKIGIFVLQSCGVASS